MDTSFKECEEKGNRGIDNQYLTFSIEDEIYGVEIANVKEIITICTITKVPHTRKYVRGIINLRGEIIPVIDIRERFSKPSKEYDSFTCIIVVEYKDYILGLIVDRVDEVIFIDENNIMPPPDDKYQYYNQFIKNIGKIGKNSKVKMILDLDKLLVEDL